MRLQEGRRRGRRRARPAGWSPAQAEELAGSREGCGHGAARPREPEEAHREELLEDEVVAHEVKLKVLVDARLGYGEDQWKALVGWIALWLGRLVDLEGSRGRWRLVGEGSRGIG